MGVPPSCRVGGAAVEQEVGRIVALEDERGKSSGQI
jgi:hypothetical protein